MPLSNVCTRVFLESRPDSSSHQSMTRNNRRIMCYFDLPNWISTCSRCCTNKNLLKYQGAIYKNDEPFLIHHISSTHVNFLCCRWWKDLDFVTTLPYARDRVVECYFWALGVYFEPQYSQARVMLVKTISMISIVDDTFDAYGTVKELEAYTDAIQRYELHQFTYSLIVNVVVKRLRRISTHYSCALSKCMNSP